MAETATATVTPIRPVESLKSAPKPGGTATMQPSAIMTGWWTVPRVRAAIDANDMGTFDMIHAFRGTITRHPRIGGQGGARGQRIATPLGVQHELTLPEGYGSDDMRSPAARMRDEVKRALFADGGPLGHDMRAYLEGELADFGMGFAVVSWTPTAGGGAVMPTIEPWPLSAVELREGRLVALTSEGSDEPIMPGDGRWLMIQASKHEPWREGAVRSLAEPFMSNANVRRDADRLSEAAGQNPVIGELPEGVAVGSKDELAFRLTINNIAKGYQAVMKRAGYNIERLKSDAAEHARIFEILWALTDKDAAHAYLGQDGTAETGSTGTYGARKVLDGVRRDLVERDCKAHEACYAQIIGPYVWYNHGRADLAPRARFLVPDEAELARAKQGREEKRAARKAFHEELSSFGDRLTPTIVKAIAAEHDVVCSDEMAEALAERVVVAAASKAIPASEQETTGAA